MYIEKSKVDCDCCGAVEEGCVAISHTACPYIIYLCRGCISKARRLVSEYKVNGTEYYSQIKNCNEM